MSTDRTVVVASGRVSVRRGRAGTHDQRERNECGEEEKVTLHVPVVAPVDASAARSGHSVPSDVVV
jgi:hypothetical protein